MSALEKIFHHIAPEENTVREEINVKSEDN